MALDLSQLCYEFMRPSGLRSIRLLIRVLTIDDNIPDTPSTSFSASI